MQPLLRASDMAVERDAAAVELLSSAQNFMEKIQQRHTAEELRGTTMESIKRQVTEAKHCDDLLAVGRKQADLRKAEAFYIDATIDYINKAIEYCQRVTGIDIGKDFASQLNYTSQAAHDVEMVITPASLSSGELHAPWRQALQDTSASPPAVNSWETSTFNGPLTIPALLVSTPSETPAVVPRLTRTVEFAAVYNMGNPTAAIVERDGIFYILSCKEHGLRFDQLVDKPGTVKTATGRIWMRASSHRRFHHKASDYTTEELFGVIVLNCTENLREKNNDAFETLAPLRIRTHSIVKGTLSIPAIPEASSKGIKRKRGMPPPVRGVPWKPPLSEDSSGEITQKESKTEDLVVEAEDDSDDFVQYFSRRRSIVARQRKSLGATIDSDSESESDVGSTNRESLTIGHGEVDPDEAESVDSFSSDDRQARSFDQESRMMVTLRVASSKLKEILC